MKASLVEQAKQLIVAAIRSGEFPVGESLPLPDELAERAQCSTATMRRVLTELADDGLLQRKRRWGTIVTRRPFLGQVTLVLSPDAHLNMLLQNPVSSALVAAGYQVEILPSCVDLAQLQQRAQAATAVCPAYLVVLSPFELEMWRQLGEHATFARQLVFSFESKWNIPGFDVVYSDQEEAGLLVMEHFLKLGHRRIAVPIGFPNEPDNWLMRSCHACCQVTRFTDAECIPYFLEKDPFDAVADFRAKEITAIWSTTDHQAMGYVQAAFQTGIRVPDEISVIGRNDTPWATGCLPQLTSVSIDPPGVADAMVNLLADQQPQHDRARDYRRVAPKLMTRASTAKAAPIANEALI